jgi:hypothetical protein
MPWLLVVLLCIALLELDLVDRLTSRSRNRGMTSGVSGEKREREPIPDMTLVGMTRLDSPFLIPLFGFHPLLLVYDNDLMEEMIHAPVYISNMAIVNEA